MISNYVERFIIDCSRKSEDNTVLNYKSDILLFLEDIKQIKKIKEYSEEQFFKSINNDDIEDWMQLVLNDNNTESMTVLQHGSYAPSSINRKISSLRLFFEYLKENKNLIEKNPFNNVMFCKEKNKKKKDILNLTEIKTVIAETYNKRATDRCFEFNSARIRFVMALMASTGLRISELLSIELQDIEKIDEDNYMINISGDRVKNDIDKRVPICGIVSEYYNEYMCERKKLKTLVDKNILILSNRGKKITRTRTESDIKKFVERAGINKTINNHSFRHIFRTSLTKNNVNESLICIIGGWSRAGLSMSGIYTHDTKDLDTEKINVCNIL